MAESALAVVVTVQGAATARVAEGRAWMEAVTAEGVVARVRVMAGTVRVAVVMARVTEGRV